MRIVFLLLFLVFPITEIWVLVKLFQQYGFVVLLYLMLMAYLGVRLIREEKAQFSTRFMQGLMQGAHPIKNIFASARVFIAGVLLFIPGVITDVIAAVLLLIPRPTLAPPAMQNPPFSPHEAANDHVIEGEFRRED
jgi:UPF0716 protein FxsA